jgi:hypothetical protein
MKKQENMFLQKIMIMLVMLFAGSKALQAQVPADVARLAGEWQMVKVEMKLYTQGDDRLLEEKSYTATEINNVNAVIPANIKFSGQEYQLQHRNGMDAGKYMVSNDRLEFKKVPMQAPVLPGEQQLPVPEEPGVVYRYDLPQTTSLVLYMSPAFYRDNTRNLAVKAVYTSYYSKKKP